MKKDIKNLNLTELEKILAARGYQRYYAKQIFLWIYKKGAENFALMSDLPKKLRNELQDFFNILSLTPAKSLKSEDGTEKFLLGLHDGSFIESVIIPAAKRTTACISSQAGCKFNCAFCASGVSGFKRNLTCAEIIEQVLRLSNHLSAEELTHIVFMGTGEPLDNYDNAIKAARIINSPDAFNIGARRITISTCGIIPGIRRLAQEGLQIELSVSLHAADEATRSKLMPVNKKYPLRELMRACREYIKETKRQITFEYVLVKEINSDLQNATKLSRILKGLRPNKVNLIPCNFIKELNLRPPDKQEALAFKNALSNAGINVTLRKPRGEDIEAACGQLRLGYESKF